MEGGQRWHLMSTYALQGEKQRWHFSVPRSLTAAKGPSRLIWGEGRAKGPGEGYTHAACSGTRRVTRRLASLSDPVVPVTGG